MKDKKMILGIGVAFLFLATVSFTYAYFSTAIRNDSVKDQVVTTGTLSLRYVDGAEIVMNNIKPGQTITKTVYVANTGTLDASYNLVWQELNNNITKDEMLIEAACTRLDSTTETESGTCSAISSSAIGSNIIKKNVSIEPNIVHKYDITITFKEANADQNYNQGKDFSGVIGINEYKDTTPQAIYCNYDGDMTQGAEFVNGVYTYRYKQHMAYSEPMGQIGSSWENIDDDGWGVVISSDVTEENITEAPCTYINDKPIVSMSALFLKTNNYNIKTIDLSNFNTSNVTNMDAMFASYNITELKGLNVLDTSNVTSMQAMFYQNASTSLDLSNFDTSKVTNMHRMFVETYATELDLSSFDTSNVTDMSDMFPHSYAATINLSSFNTNKVTNMYFMFAGAHASVLDVSSFNTSNVTNMRAMFSTAKATEIKGLENFNTSKVTNMYNMFAYTQLETYDLSSFDTSSVTDMSYMFSTCENLKTIYVSNKFSNNVSYGPGMFSGCTSLVGGAGTTYDETKVDKTYAIIDGGTSSPGYFTLKTN